ncbi:MAG TPA: MobF family relaxase [Pyrinomonadaceae bacterium]|nr:MobF family relaxase [Pyrinomonadaceae bacterium]
MMTLSKALAAGQAKDYFDAEYTSTQESYYTECEAVKGKWFGRQAEAWQLQGEVDSEHFERLCEGQHPLSGDQLVRHLTSHKYENAYGETVETGEHRAGWDATFSAPKSVSLAALVGGDKRILEAHDRSVDLALTELEKYVQARLGGNHPAQSTGKMIAAKFQHDSARPDSSTGYAAPQLHTHTVIFNVTETEYGRIKPIQPLELYRSQRYATEIYRSVLATELQKLGYELRVDGRTGAPEINGFSKEYLQASSPRREDIRREAAEMKARLAKQGIQVADGAGLRQAAAKTDRMSKQYDRWEMRSRHLEMDNRFGEQASCAVQQAHQRGSIDSPDDEIRSRAKESVTFARENAGEREAVVDKRKVLVDAFRRNLGFTTYDAVINEFERNVDNGNFIRICRNPGIEEITTSRTVAIEQSNIRKVVAGKGTEIPILEDQRFGPFINTITAKQEVTLNETQRQAVETILGSRDRIIGFEGLAGTGKTTTLRVLREAAERCGYAVQGFAPTGVAADLLAESGIRTSTLQKFVSAPQIDSVGGDKTLYVMDESSLSDTRNMFLFFQKTGPSARILLVGDTGQHQAVDAGAPFEQFLKAGMQTVTLDEIVRQKLNLRIPVEQLAKRDVVGAVKTLIEQGRVTEVVDDEDRLRAIASDYVSNSKRTLVISPANQERVAINSIIHQQLQSQGVISNADHETTILVNRQDLTGAERKFALTYVPHEDVIRYNKGSKVLGINKGDYGCVLNTNHSDNEITVQLKDGRQITYSPKRLSGVSVYKEATRQFAVGDRIQFRAPFEQAKVKNTELGTVINIAQGEFTVALSGDRIITFNPERFPHLDHGYAVTSYSSQGKTIDRVLVNAETTETDLLVNQRMAYVAISRARLDARIYTDSAADLGGALARRKDKTMALEALQKVQHSGASNNNGDDLSDHGTHRKPVINPGGESDEACSIARLKGRAILVESNAAVAQKRLDEFEKTKHLYNFEIDGEQWSLVRVDRQHRTKERQINYNKRAISAYRMRLYGLINNPLKLRGLRSYKENAANAKRQIKELRPQIEDLYSIRHAVTSGIQQRTEELRTDLQNETKTSKQLNHTLELKLGFDGEVHKETPAPEFTEKELDRLEANARILRDPKLLQTVYQYLEGHCGMTPQGIQTIKTRVGETLEFAKACLAGVNDGLRTFTENREFVPVIFKGSNGEEQTTTVSELNKEAVGQNIFARIFNTAPVPLELVNEALNQRSNDLLQERTTVKSFVDAASDIANYYGQTFMANARTDIAVLNQRIESNDVKGITQPHQTNADEHLKQMRHTIDKISLQNGPINETGIEAGIAEAELAASESLAALI